MSCSARFRAHVTNDGRLDIRASAAYIAKVLRNARLIGKRDLVVTVERPRRSRRHNAYYFAAVVTPIASALEQLHGEPVTIDVAHNFLRQRFGEPTEIVDPATGEMIQGDERTRTMSVDRYAQYILECERFGSEWLGVQWSDLDRKRLREEHTCCIGS